MKYLGDNRLSHRIVFQKNKYMECIYCGEQSKTREHAPSKLFISDPLPSDLPTVPSCKKCNNGFSSDELYAKVLIKIIKNFFVNEKLNEKDVKEAMREVKMALLEADVNYKVVKDFVS